MPKSLATRTPAEHLPKKDHRGRPKRGERLTRYIAEEAYRRRRAGASLRDVQAWVNSQFTGLGRHARRDEGKDYKGRYFRVAARWAKDGKESNAAIQECLRQLLGGEIPLEGSLLERRAVEAVQLLQGLANGWIPPVDAQGNRALRKPDPASDR